MRITTRALLAAVAAAACGCETTTVKSLPTTPADPPPRATSAADSADVADAVGGSMSIDDAVASDASASRLHEISGALLMYYALHHRLPQTLDELKPLADAGTELSVTAPSGRPYLYAPRGLAAMAVEKRLIVADPAPSATGRRWCILMPPPGGPAASVSMEVLALPEAAFRQFESVP